jgi:hypothetical protein
MVTKLYKALLATYRSIAGPIRVVTVEKHHDWYAFKGLRDSDFPKKCEDFFQAIAVIDRVDTSDHRADLGAGNAVGCSKGEKVMIFFGEYSNLAGLQVVSAADADHGAKARRIDAPFFVLAIRCDNNRPIVMGFSTRTDEATSARCLCDVIAYIDYPDAVLDAPLDSHRHRLCLHLYGNSTTLPLSYANGIDLCGLAKRLDSCRHSSPVPAQIVKVGIIFIPISHTPNTNSPNTVFFKHRSPSINAGINYTDDNRLKHFIEFVRAIKRNQAQSANSSTDSSILLGVFGRILTPFSQSSSGLGAPGSSQSRTRGFATITSEYSFKRAAKSAVDDISLHTRRTSDESTIPG